MDKSNMTFTVNSNAIGWGLASIHTRAVKSARNNPRKMKLYKENGLIDVAPSVTSFMNKYKNYINTGKLVHTDGSNFFGGIIGLSSISDTPEFRSRIKSVLQYEYGFSDTESQEVETFIDDLVKLGETDDVQIATSKTKKYKDSIERLWQTNESRIMRYIVDILGYEPQNVGKVCAFIMYPNFDTLRTSQVSKDKINLFFGKRGERDSSKLLAYMTHQAVHEPMLPNLTTMTKSQKDDYHAFIKFLTEKDVYNRLTGKSYLDIVTHDEKPEIMGKVYPFWLGYRYRNYNDSSEQIRMAINRDQEYYNNLPENSKKRKLYNTYNFEKLDPNKISRFFREKKGMTPYDFSKIDFSKVDKLYREQYISSIR